MWLLPEMEIDAAYRTQYVLRNDNLLAKVQSMFDVQVTVHRDKFL